MLTVTDANEFFSSHPAKENFAAFTEEQQNNALTGSIRDISAILGWNEFPEEPEEMLKAAVFEHALYLLLNPHVAAAASLETPLLAPRAKMFLDAVIIQRRTAALPQNDNTLPAFRLSRG